MNRLLPYKKIPIAISFIVLALFVLMLVVWVQVGSGSILYLLFLLCNYFTWGLMLPFIQGIVMSSTLHGKGIIMVITKALLLIIIHFIFSNVLYYTLQYFLVVPFTAPSLTTFQEVAVPSFMGRALDFLLFFGLLSWMHRSREVNEKEIRLIATESSLQTMRLKSLQSQLNPHFLFNTLHAVSSLIGRDDDKAREITIKISGLLRKVLEANDQESYTLQREIDLIHDYLAIEQERFKDRLTINMHIDEGVENVIVPTFILQPIIENAFKHGIANVEGKTVLLVSIKRNDEKQQLNFEVINDMSKQPISNSNSTGIGLSNLQERLDAFYHQHISFLACETKEFTYCVNFSVPLEE